MSLYFYKVEQTWEESVSQSCRAVAGGPFPWELGWYRSHLI